MLNALIIGYGSIGRRHADILLEIGCSISFVSRHKKGDDFFASIQDALSKKSFDYVVIATETSEHFEDIKSLSEAGFCGKVLVEKPIFGDFSELSPNNFEGIHVAYNLRFHPALQKLKLELKGQRIISAQLYVGQYLPDWRPNQDYRKSYSADRKRGGGVLRDLSHELDYACWLFGDVKKIVSLGGKLSDLEIDSDDCWGILASFEHCPVATIQLNYLDRAIKRELVIITSQHSYHLDFITNTLVCDKEKEVFSIDRNTTYRLQHETVISKSGMSACTVQEALSLIKIFNKVEKSALEAVWIN